MTVVSVTRKPSLYGFTDTNSNRKGKDLWGKNQFNSNLPVSLACYMRNAGIKPVYLSLDGNLDVVVSEISFDEVFNTTAPNQDLFFSFETKYDPYMAYAIDDFGHIDLVVKHGENFLRPLEIKLTVVPDHSTYKNKPEHWGPELVIRPATTIYCALGIADSCMPDIRKIRSIIEPVCSGISDSGWENQFEMDSRKKSILDAIDTMQREFFSKQKPYLMQPIWRTKGKEPELADNALDIFVWSDFALTRLFLDASRRDTKVNRLIRSSMRFARFLHEFSTTGRASIKKIYTTMAHEKQTDKEFSVNGSVTRTYMKDPRLIKPILEDTILKEIILAGGENELRPERRFDQTIYFTAKHLFEKI